jgi:hypothetical protein
LTIPLSREIRVVICFLRAKNMSAAEIHRELRAAVYSQNIMGEVILRQCVEYSKMGEQMFMMKSEVVCHL